MFHRSSTAAGSAVVTVGWLIFSVLPTSVSAQTSSTAEERFEVDDFGMRDRSWGVRSQFGADMLGGTKNGGYTYRGVDYSPELVKLVQEELRSRLKARKKLGHLTCRLSSKIIWTDYRQT